MNRRPGEIIIHPLFTEKSSTSLESDGTDGVGRRLQARMDRGEVEPRLKYTFKVAPDANKIEIRKAFEEMFEARVAAVRTINVRGKKKRRGRAVGRRAHWKKAIIEVVGGPVDVERI